VALEDEQERLVSLEAKCEQAREQALAPIRQRRTQECIEQKMYSPEHCEEYYTTYGNVERSASGAPTEGSFYDLPVCQQWLAEREKAEHSQYED
jgi:hypothetical protein